MKRLMIKTLVAAAALAAFGLASAQDVREHTIKFATQNPKGHPIMVGMEKFAEVVQAKSGGKIKVNLFPLRRAGRRRTQCVGPARRHH